MRRASGACKRILGTSHAVTCGPGPLALQHGRICAPNTTSLQRHGQQTRTFFGIGEIVGVLTNPAETVRSLTESRRLLEEARMEIRENRERAQLRPAHTFSRLPGFFQRPAEIRAIESALEGDPSFTVLFGASSVGKTALLREVLSRPAYHVLHFDLRIAGFADLGSLYMSLSQQMELYFEAVVNFGPEWKDFEKEAWSFKHDRLTVERRMAEVAQGVQGIGQVKTSDIARLMELFQSSLLKYWEFEPPRPPKKETENEEDPKFEGGTIIVNHTGYHGPSGHTNDRGKSEEDTKGHVYDRSSENGENEEGPPPKKVPVVFFDEGHKLPALIRSLDAMKCILDSMLVLTKQDRLCHVIHATSDPFYQTWLRQLNVMQHCKIITIGDTSKGEARRFFSEQLLPRVPERLRAGLPFDGLYDAFGGKLAHWADYVTDYVNADGGLHITRSTHFVQAHALLHLHLLHSAAPPAYNSNDSSSDLQSNGMTVNGRGFQVYSPLIGASPHAAPSPSLDERSDAPGYTAGFTRAQLLDVMARLVDSESLSYFELCREMGVDVVDGMVKGRILELRWTEAVTKEDSDAPSARDPFAQTSAMDTNGATVLATQTPSQSKGNAFIGPKLLPTTPIMRYAMREVVREYGDKGSA